MKYWLAAALALGLLYRLPHPAQDIADLAPVRAVYLYMEGDIFHIETDTGHSGAGPDLSAAAAHMKSGADMQLYLDTAEFLILHPNVPVAEAFYTLFRPDCRVIYSTVVPDLQTVSEYLSIHTPSTTLAQFAAKMENAE